MSINDISKVMKWFWDFEDTALFERSLSLPISDKALEDSWRSALEFADPPKACWFIAVGENHAAGGIAGLQAINFIHGDAVLPFFVEKRLRTRGLATALSIVMLDVAFKQLRLHRVTTFYRSDHRASHRVLSRLGFREEGRRREGWYADGKRHDTVQVGILNDEWNELRAEIIERHASEASVSVNVQRPLERKFNES